MADLALLDLTADYRVADGHDDDPVLLRPDGTPVETWREDYPYDERLDREEYDRDKRLLQARSAHRTRRSSGRPG
ncbi:hypothetical protein PSH03_003087 [Micromonospora sp. PSH03]|uniref:hypothetical protein n=1 Tax=Micromonospora TaxID=1873 RepID=UPI001EE9353D|nr:hypothetical protein [Micromonospora salmantinae]MCG5457966.1 hypothetical protein [Micromonospora salmantinae]